MPNKGFSIGYEDLVKGSAPQGEISSMPENPLDSLNKTLELLNGILDKGMKLYSNFQGLQNRTQQFQPPQQISAPPQLPAPAQTPKAELKKESEKVQQPQFNLNEIKEWFDSEEEFYKTIDAIVFAIPDKANCAKLATLMANMLGALGNVSGKEAKAKYTLLKPLMALETRKLFADKPKKEGKDAKPADVQS